MEKTFFTTGNKCGNDSRMQTGGEMSWALATRWPIILQHGNAVFLFFWKKLFLVFKTKLAGVLTLISHHSKRSL